MQMSVPTEHTAVMLMLFVATPVDPITARAKMDFMVAINVINLELFSK